MTTLQRAPTRNVRTPVMDSTRWDEFPVRADDIVIATYPKCGTTWMQRIVDLLVFQDPAPRAIMDASVWLDARFFATQEEDRATLEAQSHRRFIKSHLPFDALPIYDTVKYIHVARDGRDAFLSWHNHTLGFTAEAGMRVGAVIMSDPLLAPLMANGPPPATPEDPQVFFQTWIARAEAEASAGPGAELSYFDFENTYWAERGRENLLFVHYSDLKADLAGEMRRISDFLEIDTPPARLAELAEAAGFEAMKANGEALLPKIKTFFDKGPERFLNKGANGRWRDVLTEADLQRFDAVFRRKVSPSCASWLEHGRLIAGDPRQLAD
ncbi:MAG: sulfotransferase domain-containing protein [Phenylobacterium sp.]